MQTQHYYIQNLNDYHQTKLRLEKYLNDIESVFRYIEKVYGQTWNQGQINIFLEKTVGCSYTGKNNNTHIVKLGFEDDIVQSKEFPENLWGCLLHETLHAFAFSIIYKPNDVVNELDEYCFDNGPGEPFIFSFQSCVYTQLNKKDIINDDLNQIFQQRLKSELKDDGLSLFEKYLSIFNDNRSSFAKFVSLLESNDKAMITKVNFWEDLKKITELITS